jgi:hypothetical protein
LQVLSKEAQTAKIQATVDNEIVKYLETLTQREQKKDQAFKKEEVSDQKEAAEGAYAVSSPLSNAIDRLKAAIKVLKGVFGPIILKANVIAKLSNSIVAEINSNKIITAPATEIDTEGLRHMVALFKSAEAMLLSIGPLPDSFSQQYKRVMTVAWRELTKLKVAMKSPTAKRLAMSLEGTEFMALTHEYQTQVVSIKRQNQYTVETDKLLAG